jgi:group I intron endonuclease
LQPNIGTSPTATLFFECYQRSRTMKTNTELETGVYCIRNTTNGKVYVGSASISIKDRWKYHRRDLRGNRHHSILLQRAWHKYGEDVFEFLVLELCLPADCVSREQHWIDQYRAANNKFGYNVNPTAGSTLGRKHTAETKAKLKIISTGRIKSAETRAKLSAASKIHCPGRKLSPETKAKISAAQKRRDPELNRKHSERMRGRTLSSEHRAKIGASKVGKRRSAKALAAIKAGIAAKGGSPMRGIKRSAETVAKISATLTGHKCSAETRAKISVANKGKKRKPTIICE